MAPEIPVAATNGEYSFDVIAPPEVPPSESNLLAQLEAGWHAYGDAFEVAMHGLRCVVVAHPADIRRVLTDKNYSDKGPLYNGVRQVLGDGILTSGGTPWKENRRVITPAFQPGQIDQMADTIAKVGGEFASALCMRPEEKVIDVQEEMTALTLDTLMATLFGQRIEAIDDLSYDTLTSAFALADSLATSTSPKKELQATYDLVTTRLDGVAQKMIDEARQGEADGTLLSLLIHSKKEAGAYLDDATIRNELLTIIFAGHETTALTLTWLHKLLEDRGDISERIQREVDTVLADRPPRLEDLPKLTYTRQVIDEVLRLKPAVPLIARSVNQEAQLRDIELHPGDGVLPFISAAHRHPEFWTDPETFNPDRFSAAHSIGRDRWSYVPFAAGNRICLGKNLALAELTIHAALLAQHTEIQVQPNDAAPEMRMTLRPSRPIYATVRPRKSRGM